MKFVFVQDFNQNGLLFYNSFLVLGPMLVLALLTEDLQKVREELRVRGFIAVRHVGLEFRWIQGCWICPCVPFFVSNGVSAQLLDDVMHKLQFGIDHHCRRCLQGLLRSIHTHVSMNCVWFDVEELVCHLLRNVHWRRLYLFSGQFHWTEYQVSVFQSCRSTHSFVIHHCELTSA